MALSSETPLEVAYRGVVAGLAATVLLSVLARILPGMSNQPNQEEADGEAIQSARVVLAQLEVPMQCVLEAARLAGEAGARFVLDPAPAVPLPDELFPLLTVIRPNSSEAEALTGIAVKDVDAAREVAGALLNRGVGGRQCRPETKAICSCGARTSRAASSTTNAGCRSCRSRAWMPPVRAMPSRRRWS
jgi:sugar/nucleoside kinase (ribokinase family)